MWLLGQEDIANTYWDTIASLARVLSILAPFLGAAYLAWRRWWKDRFTNRVREAIGVDGSEEVATVAENQLIAQEAVSEIKELRVENAEQHADVSEKMGALSEQIQTHSDTLSEHILSHDARAASIEAKTEAIDGKLEDVKGTINQIVGNLMGRNRE